MAISWRFDGDDRLCGVGGHWTEFALANNGGACVPPPIGDGLADFVSGADLCVVWRAIFRLSRGRGERPLVLGYRCDAPAERRLMKATVTSTAHGGIEIVSAAERSQARTPLPLLDPDAGDRGSEMLRMCGWCARVQVGDWVDIEEGCRRLGLLERGRTPLPAITHGVCGDCLDSLTRDLDVDRRHLTR
ncbi:hypothetical protein [Paractinoplanes rishiriensis]|uniref:Uncharacterized protein n=1 Tax=Paractinoplanes rishiriensis TaxID=1050105 RepID=A0A919JV64_9ACTN|nr:hypothetical protein [Actinoplanes rishiriensis]GIE94210.1 hypothetical protein Ari01nite_16750 [Actinoplanes rishiriensis]